MKKKKKTQKNQNLYHYKPNSYKDFTSKNSPFLGHGFLIHFLFVLEIFILIH